MASRLIADDRDCTFQEAFKVMVASGDVGDSLQAIDNEGKDEAFDDIIMKIMWKPAPQASDDLASQAVPQVKGKVCPNILLLRVRSSCSSHTR